MLRRRAAQARAAQQRLLQRMQALDDACTAHMAHGAMSGADPLTDSLYSQLEAQATEGAQPPITYPAGQTPEPDHLGWWLTGCTLLAALIGAGLMLPGAAA